MSDNNAPAAGRTDTETIIAAVIAGMNAKPPAAAAPVAAQAPAAAPAATPAAEPAPQSASEAARIFAILECEEAKERPSLAKTLAKNEKIGVDEARALLAAAAVEKPAASADLGNALAARMAERGNAAGIKPDSQTGKPSLAEKFASRFQPKTKGA